MNWNRVGMYASTVCAACWFALGIVTGLPGCAVGVVGFTVLAYINWKFA